LDPVVDFHAYFQPKGYLDRLRARNTYPRIEDTPQGEAIFSGPGAARLIRPENTDIDWRLRALTEAGIDSQVLRLQNVSGVEAFDPVEGLEIAQAANEEMAQIANRHPGCFIPFTAVPMTDVRGAVAEIERSVTKLGHRGVGLSTNAGARGEGRWLDHPELRPLLECAAHLDVPVIVLPNHPSMIDAHIAPWSWLTGAYGFQVDLTTVALRLLNAGVFDRLPKLRIILANMGGVLPFMLDRLEQYWSRVHAGSRPLREPPREALRRFWYETASGHPSAIRAAAEILGVERFVFGSDYPSFDFVRAIRSVRSCGLPPEDIERILRGNAVPLLKPWS
jgi:predicted TIM-barrel fold metal-dependent hydrolase